jgi:hypothetical protein
MNRTLYEISSDLLALDELLSEVEGDVTDDEACAAIDAWLAELGSERNRKLDAYAALLRNYEALADVAETESLRLAELANARRKTAERLKTRLKEFFAQHNLTKLSTERFSFAVIKNGGKAPLLIPDSWLATPAAAPERFHRRRIELNKEDIRAALEAGELIPGCAIDQRGTHLRIK